MTSTRTTRTRLAAKAGMLGLNLLLASGIGIAQTAPTGAGYAPPLGSNGSGSGGVFSFSATDPDGAADINTLIVVTNSVFSGWGGCYFLYDRPSNSIYLSSASGTSETWSSIAVGSSATTANPYCTIHGDQGTQVILSGNTLTLKVYITFNSSWTGTKYFYLLPIDTAGGQPPWASDPVNWKWNVQSSGAPTGANYAPPLGSNGSGLGGVFSFSATDPDGAADINTIIVVANSSLTGWGGCYFFYDRPSNQVYLSSASQPETWTPLVVGSSDTKQSPYCTIRGDQGSQVVLSGNTLTLKLNITFNSTWVGIKNFYLLPVDTAGGQLANTWVNDPVNWKWDVEPPPPPPDYTMSVVPASGTIAMAKSTTPLNYTVNVIVPPSNPFSGTVTLGAVGLPGGATATFNPPAITGAGSSVMSIAMNNVSVASNFTFSVIGQSGALSRAANGQISVRDFVLTVSPKYQVVAWQTGQGTPLPANFSVSASGLNGFNQPLAVSFGPIYVGPIQQLCVQQTITANWPATLNTAPATTVAGTINFASPPTGALAACYLVTATANGVSHSQEIYVDVKTASDFSINVTGPQTIGAPSSATYSVTTPGINTFNGPVALSAYGMPAGITATFGPTTNGVTSLTLSAAAGTIPNTYLIGISGTSGGITRTNAASLTIQGSPDFTVTTTPITITSIPNGVASLNVLVSGSQGFAGSVTVTPSGLPSGAVLSPASQTVTGSGMATFVLTTTNSALGSTTFPVTAVSGTKTHQTSARLSISAPGPANIIIPSPGSTLTSSSETFRWTPAVGATQYQITLGSSPGGYNLQSISTGVNQSATVSLPPVGTTFYATILSNVSGVWLPSQSYSYQRGNPLGNQLMSVTVPSASSINLTIANDGKPAQVGPIYQPYCLPYPNPCDNWPARFVTACRLYVDATANSPSIAGTVTPISSTFNERGFNVEFKVPSSVSPGPKSVSCRVGEEESPKAPNLITVYDASPVITEVIQYPPDTPGGPFYITIHGTNFGKSPGTVSVCRSQTTPCVTNPLDFYSISYNDLDSSWNSPEGEINVLLSPQPDAGGLFDVAVNSAGASGLGFFFNPQNAGASNQSGKKDGAVSLTVPVSMKLERVGPTVISSDGKYSEDTTIRVTAVRSDNGQVLTGFTGSVNIAEAGTGIYLANGGTLPPQVNITSGGTATFVAKSLAGPNGPNPPSPAQIKTTNFTVFGATSLSVPQWIISSTKIDPKASSLVFDWLQKRVLDIYSAATMDVKTVLDSVTSYTIFYSETAAGQTSGYVVSINPFFGGVSDRRIDSITIGSCGTSPAKSLTRTVLHEARHAFQYKLVSTPGNNSDSDYLPKVVTIAPLQYIVDSTDERQVCDQSSDQLELRRYKGDLIPDVYELDPAGAAFGWVARAWEMDSWVFASTHAQ